jgi:hypothetical protein
MPNRLAVSANDTPYSLISFNAIALLSVGNGGRRLPDSSMATGTFSFLQNFHGPYRYQQSCAFQYPGQSHDAMSPAHPALGLAAFQPS